MILHDHTRFTRGGGNSPLTIFFGSTYVLSTHYIKNIKKYKKVFDMRYGYVKLHTCRSYIAAK